MRTTRAVKLIANVKIEVGYYEDDFDPHEFDEFISRLKEDEEFRRQKFLHIYSCLEGDYLDSIIDEQLDSCPIEVREETIEVEW